jgi:hypothetical protein
MEHESLDKQRLNQEWDEMKKELEKLGTFFDQFEGPPATQQTKCYYWICSSEISFHAQNDFSGAVDCLRRASVFQFYNDDRRILTVRYFLRSFQSLYTCFSSPKSHLLVENTEDLMKQLQNKEENNNKKLHHNRCCNIRDYIQCKNSHPT